MYKENPRKLEDVDISDIYTRLDPGIVNLVRAIRSLGFGTWGSCEGGFEGSHHIHQFPWVTVAGLADENGYVYRRITEMIVRFNETSEVRWATEWAALKPSELAVTDSELEKLHTSADTLARFLFDQRDKFTR